MTEKEFDEIYKKVKKELKMLKYKKIIFHNKLELSYAKYLDKIKSKWKYRPKPFNLGGVSYTPSFICQIPTLMWQ